MKDKLQDYEEWDSLAVLSVASMLNKEFGIIISSSDFNKFQKVKDLYIYVIENRGNG